MILVRDVFRAKFGMGQEAVTVLKEGIKIIKKIGSIHSEPRLLMDFSGPFFTIVLETTHVSLAEYEKSLNALMAHDNFSDWYRTVVPVMEGGDREIYTIIK